MQQFILLSVLMATLAIPAVLARRREPAGYASVLRPFSAFVAVYVLLLLFVYPRLF